MAVTLESTVRQSEDQVSAEVDGEVVMMSVEQGNYYGLDEVGSRVWQLVAEPRRVADVCDQLQQEYEVEREACEGDVLKFLNDLAEQGLVQVA